MTEYEFIEYLSSIYNVAVLSVEMERVEEQTMTLYELPKSMLESDTTVKDNSSARIGYNDRFKIANVILEQPFKFPEFTKSLDLAEESYKFPDDSTKEEAFEYIGLVRNELMNSETRKIGNAKKRHFEDTVNWLHTIVMDDFRDTFKDRESQLNRVRMVTNAAEDKDKCADYKLMSDIAARTGIPGSIWDAWIILNICNIQLAEQEEKLTNPIAEYILDSDKTFFEGGMLRAAIESVAQFSDKLSPTYRKMMDKHQREGQSSLMRRARNQQLTSVLKSHLGSDQDTYKICSEILDLDASERCEGGDILSVNHKFLEYLKLANKEDSEKTKFSSLLVIDPLQHFDASEGLTLKKYSDILEERKNESERKPLRFKKKMKNRRT